MSTAIAGGWPLAYSQSIVMTHLAASSRMINFLGDARL